MNRGWPGGVVAVFIVLMLVTWLSGDEPLSCSSRLQVQIDSEEVPDARP